MMAKGLETEVLARTEKTRLLLIETFRDTKLWPPGSTPSGHLLFVRVNSNFAFWSIGTIQNNVGGFIGYAPL
jgi:hypothetical protein